MSRNLKTLDLYQTGEHPCNYLPGRAAGSLIVDPRLRITTDLYSKLIDLGFRRNAEYVYRPLCEGCAACIPVRVPVSQFRPRRQQNRAWQHNQDLQVTGVGLTYKEEHFRLYERYLAVRHSGGGMDQPSRKQFGDYILNSELNQTTLYEFRLHEELLAVAVVDHLPQGLSAVYTFFDPEYATRSLGTFAVLWQIQEARHLGLSWLYLGYWIRDCQKMRYKGDYRPLEIFRDGQWQRLAS